MLSSGPRPMSAPEIEITSEEFRDALRLVPGAVTLVTTRDAEGRTHGMTVSAFSSISAEPPLVGVFVERSSNLAGVLGPSGSALAVNVLAEDQDELSNRFAFEKDEDRFLEGAWSSAATGAPILVDALTWLDCRLEARHELGTHDLLVGRVVAAARPRDGDRPLLYWDRAYRRLG